MRRCLIVMAGMMLWAAVPAAAQQVDLALKGGVNISTIDAEDSDVRVGFVGGGSVSFPISEKLAFRPEFLYTQKGAKGQSDEGEIQLRVNYLEIPLLAEITFPTKSSRRPFIAIGPAIGFRAGAKLKLLGTEVDIDEFVKSTELSFVVGGGVNYHRFGFEARYTMGLSNVFTDEFEDLAEVGAKNRTVSVLLSYVIQR